jgi:hypothetical protein
MSGEAPDIREDEDCPSGKYCDWACDQHEGMTAPDERAELVAEIERLRGWKAEALPVLAGLQEVGRALGVPLGRQITARATVNAALDLRNERDEAIAVLAPVAALADEWRKYHDDGLPNAYTLIYGDAANLLRRRLADPDAVAQHNAAIWRAGHLECCQSQSEHGPDAGNPYVTDEGVDCG